MEGGRCTVMGGAIVPTANGDGRISPSPSSASLAGKAASLASGASTASLVSLEQVRDLYFYLRMGEVTHFISTKSPALQAGPPHSCRLSKCGGLYLYLHLVKIEGLPSISSIN